MFNLQHKVAIVTGGGSGIGKAIAQVFAKKNAHVYILDFDEKAAKQVAEEINESGHSAEAFACDVSNKVQVVALITQIARAHKARIDILVNNAGIAQVGNIENADEDAVNKLINVNIKGVYHCMQAVIPFMKKNGGSILNMASIASLVGIQDRFIYSMTKGAVVGMSLSVARDYLAHGIRCNCISPARVHTPFVDGFIKKNYEGKEEEMFEKLSKSQPIGRMAAPEEVAYLALYLCSNEASFISGNDYPIDGGFVKLNN